MRNVFVGVVLAVTSVLFAQESGIYEEDTSLPTPYLDSTGSTVAPESEAPRQPTTTKVIIRQSGGMGPVSDMKMIRANARRGVGTYVAGFVLEYGVAVPLAIAAIANYDEGLLLGSAVVELISTGFFMAGPIRAGVAASEAYDYSRRQGFAMEKNSNWGYYRAGWVLKIVGAVCSQINNLSMQGGGMDQGTAQTLSIIALGSTIASDALWMTSVINAAQYTRKVEGRTRRSSFSLYPTYSLKTGSVGLGMQLIY